ncbi:MAG TPA: hypothetical protein VM121_02920, partial [Acidimicrobiales bacterium]|nr:hypothetical protein [Acidimicrobiales bacterium]
MRRLVLIAILLPAIVFGGTGLLTAAPAVAQLPPDDPARGLAYAGLRPADPNGPCRGHFELASSRAGRAGPPACSHGPDPAPPGVDVRQHRDPAEIAAETAAAPVTAAATAGIQCHPDFVGGPGTTGNRVQAIYAHTGTSSLATLRPTFEQAAATADFNFNASAAETGGVRHLRFVTDASCNLVIADVQLSTAANPDMDTMIADLKAKGYSSPSRKYLVWMDATNYCGIGDLFIDESPSQLNENNGKFAQFARVDTSCWNRAGQSVETHELTHTLGSVQPGAPRSTANYHCTDESDRMCYDDHGNGQPAVTLTQTCPPFHEQRLDCRHDDY